MQGGLGGIWASDMRRPGKLTTRHDAVEQLPLEPGRSSRRIRPSMMKVLGNVQLFKSSDQFGSLLEQKAYVTIEC